MTRMRIPTSQSSQSVGRANHVASNQSIIFVEKGRFCLFCNMPFGRFCLAIFDLGNKRRVFLSIARVPSTWNQTTMTSVALLCSVAGYCGAYRLGGCALLSCCCTHICVVVGGGVHGRGWGWAAGGVVTLEVIWHVGDDVVAHVISRSRT